MALHVGSTIVVQKYDSEEKLLSESSATIIAENSDGLCWVVALDKKKKVILSFYKGTLESSEGMSWRIKDDSNPS
jgi:hypothetical protein